MQRRQLNVIALGIGWLISLGVVFVLGILSAFAFHLKPGVDSVGTGFSIEERELALVIERITGNTADLAALKAHGPQGGLPEQVEQTLRGILRIADPEVRAASARTVAAGLPSRQLMAAIRFIQEIPPAAARNSVLEALLREWAAKDGRSASAFSTSLQNPVDRDLAIASVLKGWAKVAPREAWSWVVDRYGTPRRAQPLLEIILLRLDQLNRPQAIELLDSLPASPTQADLASVLMDQILTSSSPAQALSWLAELPESTQSPAGGRIARAWARSDPPAAATWFHQNFPREIEPLREVLQEWVYRDATAAADWVWRTFKGESARRLLDTVATEWVANDGPAPLARWINANGPGAALDGAIETLALATATVDPDTALIWAQSISDPESRAMLRLFITREWQAEGDAPVVAAQEPLLEAAPSADSGPTAEELEAAALIEEILAAEEVEREAEANASQLDPSDPVP